MYLVKTLRKEHRNSAIKYGKIRIGTINYYKKIEDDSRTDPNEGMGHIVWAGNELSAKDHNRLFTPFDHVELSEGWTIQNKGAKLIGSTPDFNTYVFCFSQVKNICQIKKTSGGKAKHWYYITDLRAFVKAITKEITKSITDLIRKHEPAQADHLISHLRVFDVTYKINYTDLSKDKVVTEENVKDFNPKRITPQDFHQKDTSYMYEKEVRTVWFFESKDNEGRKQLLPIPPDTDYIDLELGRLPVSKWPKRNNFPLKTAKPNEEN